MHSDAGSHVLYSRKPHGNLRLANVQEVQPLPCRTEPSDGQGLMGSYKPVTAEDEKNGLVNDFAPVAWQNFTQNQSITGCLANSVHPVSFNVTQACKQVTQFPLANI